MLLLCQLPSSEKHSFKKQKFIYNAEFLLPQCTTFEFCSVFEQLQFYLLLPPEQSHYLHSYNNHRCCPLSLHHLHKHSKHQHNKGFLRHKNMKRHCRRIPKKKNKPHHLQKKRKKDHYHPRQLYSSSTTNWQQQ